MRMVIIGAGAIGGSLGACLIRAGHDVMLVDSVEEHVEAIRGPGLKLEGREEFTVRGRAVTPDALASALGADAPDVFVLTVKAQHTQEALRPVLPLLRAESAVLSMQNGLNPHAVAALVGGDRTLAACINSMAADYLEPGRIMFGGPGTIRLGELDGRMMPRLERLAELLRDSYVANTQATSNVWGHLWSKEAYGAWLFATAVSGEPVADALDAPANRTMLANLAAEVIAVAECEGVRLEAVDGFEPDALRFGVPRDSEGVLRCLAGMAALNRRSHKPRSGIWRDLAVRRRRTEVDAQLGIVVELGAKHGIAVPLIERLVEIIHALERGESTMGSAHTADLRAVDAKAYAVGAA
jgi:2-dehydropantoate 2-reductase